MAESVYAEARQLDAIVFIDGVEVPYATLEISWGVDSPSTCQLMLEPDEIIDEWRPKAWVHVFVRDPFEQTAPAEQIASQAANAVRDINYDKETYQLYWEGEVVGIQDVESDSLRNTMVTAMDLWNVPMFTSTALVNIASGVKVPLVNGSTFYGDLLGDNQTDFIIQNLVAKLFETEKKFTFDDNGEEVETTKLTKAKLSPDKIAVGILRYLGAFNAGYGLQLSRTDLLSKIAGINDRAVERFLTTKLALDLMNYSVTAQPSASVLDFVTTAINKFFYHYVSVPFPAPYQIAGPGEAQANKSSYRSMLVLPNVYYSLPPMCNYLFPDQYKVRDVSRSFMSEPTRLGLHSASLAFGEVVHLAPENITAFLKQNGADAPSQGKEQASDKMMGTQDDLDFAVKEPVDTMDLNKIGLEGTDNMLRYLMPEEVEKGVLYKPDMNAYQEILSLGELNSDFSELREGDRQAAAERYKRAVERRESYPNYMRLLAQYQLQFQKNSRKLNIVGPFNPWPIVGLPMLVLRQGRSYRGVLTTMTSRIDFNGAASTQYALGFVQLLRTDTFANRGESFTDAVKAFRRAQGQAATLETEVTKLSDLSGLSAAERRELEQLPTADKLGVLLAKADETAARSELDQKFQEEYTYRRNNLEAALGKSNFYFGVGRALVDYGSFLLGALGLKSRPDFGDSGSLSFSKTYQDGVSAGSALSGLAEQIARGLREEGKLPDNSASSASATLAFINLVWNVVAWGSVVQDSIEKLLIAGSIPEIENGFRNLVTLFDAVNQRKIQLEIADIEGALEQLEAAASDLFDERFKPNPGEERNAEIKAQTALLDETIAEQKKKKANLEKLALPESRWDYSTTLNTVFFAQLTAVQSNAYVDGVVSFSEGTIRSFSLAELYKANPNVAVTNILNFISKYDGREGAGTAKLSQFLFNNLLSSVVRELLAMTKLSILVDPKEEQQFRQAVDKIFESYSEFARFVGAGALEIPPVYPFSNDKLLDIGLVDEALADVVQPRNTERGRRIQDPAGTYAARAAKARGGDSIDASQTRGLLVDITTETLVRYDEFLRVLQTIFPVTADDTDTEYQRAKTEGVVHEWANNLQARKTVSLGDFLTINGIKLKSEAVVNFGVTTMFYQMADDETSGLTDEFTKYGARSFFSKFGNKDKDKLRDNINTIRTNATKAGAAPDWKFTLSTHRQAIVLQYTRNHITSGGFQGKR